jgi:hypothetical protein
MLRKVGALYVSPTCAAYALQLLSSTRLAL